MQTNQGQASLTKVSSESLQIQYKAYGSLLAIAVLYYNAAWLQHPKI